METVAVPCQLKLGTEEGSHKREVLDDEGITGSNIQEESLKFNQNKLGINLEPQIVAIYMYKPVSQLCTVKVKGSGRPLADNKNLPKFGFCIHKTALWSMEQQFILSQV